MKWLLPVLLLGASALGGCASVYRVSVTPAKSNDVSLDRIAGFLAAEGFDQKKEERQVAHGRVETAVWWEGKMSGKDFLWGRGAITVSAEVRDNRLSVYLHQVPNGDPKLLRSFGMKLAAKLKEVFPEAEVTVSWAPHIQLAFENRPNKSPEPMTRLRPVMAHL